MTRKGRLKKIRGGILPSPARSKLFRTNWTGRGRKVLLMWQPFKNYKNFCKKEFKNWTRKMKNLKEQRIRSR